MGRNTAAAVALAALAIDRPASEVMAVLPADHGVADAAGFRAALAAAAERAAGGDLVTLGITPRGPETGYGYVLATGDAVLVQGMASYRVERFVEKPSVERATELLAGGRASWNAGIFVWRRDAVRQGLERHAADIVAPLEAALAAGPGALEAAYPGLRSTSIDYALLEPTSLEGHVAVIPAEVGWSDLGSWASLLEALSTDEPRAARRSTPEAIAVDGAEALETGAVGQVETGSEVITVGSRTSSSTLRAADWWWWWAWPTSSWWTRPMRCWCAPGMRRRTSSASSICWPLRAAATGSDQPARAARYRSA